MSLFPDYETKTVEGNEPSVIGINEQLVIDLYNRYLSTFDDEKVQAVMDYVSNLSQYHSDLVCNPWGDVDPALDMGPEAIHIRQRNLIAYLLPRLGSARIFVVAEAVGYQGGRFSGIAITCERMMVGLHKTIHPHNIAKVPLIRTSSTKSDLLKPVQQTQGFNEPTDTVVWNAIMEQGIDPYDVLLWNIFPFHPYKVNNSLSNRTPTETEQTIGWEYTKQLLELHRTLGGQNPLVLAVGKKSAETMQSFGLDAIPLRHPANGGANLYREQFKAVVETHKNN